MARPLGKRYDHPSGGNRPPVTPSRIRRLGRDLQVRLIVGWFSALYEDPANETPYDGREGGYQYIHGGPYDAREEIEAEFVDYVDAEIIESAADFVESTGILDWAPSARHPDRIATDREAEASLDADNRFFDFDGGFQRSPIGLPNLGEGVFYSVPWDKDARISPSEVRNLPPEKQQDLIEHWFYQMFGLLGGNISDPAIHQQYPFHPRQTYKAKDAIFNEFIESADQDNILAVIAKVHASGGDVWGPGPYHPDRAGLEVGVRPAQDLIADHDQIDARLERGVRTSFGTTYERAVRRTVQTQAADLKALLAKPGAAKVKHGGIGHNHPPSDIELDEEHSEQLKEAVETIDKELSAELRNEQPDVRKVSRAARAIQSIGRWVARKLDMTLDTFLKAFATGLAGVALVKLDVIIHETLRFYQWVIDWLNAVVLPL